MNIQIQLCGIVLLLVIYYFYGRQRKVHLDTGTVFFRALLMALASISLDVLSIIGITYMEYLPLFLVKLLCRLYLVSLVSLAICTLFYICVDVYSKRVQYKKVLYWNGSIACAAIPFILFLPISIKNLPESGQVYTYGPAVVLTYICAVLYLLVNLYLLFHKRESIAQGRQHAVLFWMMIWLGAALIQFFNNEILVVGYASAIGVMVLYLKLENPEMNLDRQTGLFNHTALNRYLKQLGGNEQKFSAVILVMEHSFYKNLSQQSEEEAEMTMIKYLLSFREIFAFKNSGDEITLICKNEEDAREKMETLKRRFELGWGTDESVFLRPSWIFLPTSEVLRDAADLNAMVKHVRQNVKELVDDGTVEITRELANQMYKTKEMEQIIFTSIERNWITIYYQPIYSTEKKCFASAEALVRITDEEGKVIPPYDFVWVAEKNGMMLRLGEIIFRKICAFIKDNDLKALGMEYIEVNLSAIQCAYEPLAENYIEIMKSYGIEPGFINFEITETAAIGNRSIVLGNMEKMIDFGASFSLDDFGTGQSNLNYIVELPVKIVKFDKNMTNAYFEDRKARYVMDAAMHMIHGMNLKIVSEGIETEEQLSVMERLGINYIQGYYFSKPIPETDFLAFLRENNKNETF